MALSQNSEGMRLRSAFDSICEEIYYLVEHKSNINCRYGKIVSDTDMEMMKISYADSASKEFWKPYNGDANLKEELDGYEDMVAEIEEEYKYDSETQTVGAAYLLSLPYSRFLYFCVAHAALDNPIFDSENFLYIV